MRVDVRGIWHRLWSGEKNREPANCNHKLTTTRVHNDKGSVDVHVCIEVEGEGLAFYQHGVKFERGEGEGVAGGGGGVQEKFAHEVGGVDLHLGGEFAGEEGNQEEVELAVAGEALDAGVAEAYGFAFCFGNEGDV